MPGRIIEQLHTSFTRTAPQIIRAALVGDDACSARGIMARGTSPILGLCRELLAAGADPSSQLDVYRGDTLALIVASIGQGSRLTVKTAGNGAPIFVLDGAWRGAGAPPVAPAEQAGVEHQLRAIAGAAP